MTKKTTAITVPTQISLLMEAVNCDNPDAAKLLVRKSLLLSHGKNHAWPATDAWTDKDLDAVVSLIRGIKPKDNMEMILAAQIVSLHLKSMTVMAKDNYNIMGSAMSMMKLSHQALNMLQQYRGKTQSINVNYNVHSEGDTVLNSMVQGGANDKINDKT